MQDQDLRNRECTMVQNRKKNTENSHRIIHFLTSEGVREVSKQWSAAECARASKQVSGASEQANSRASGPVLQSGFLVTLAHRGFEKSWVSTPFFFLLLFSYFFCNSREESNFQLSSCHIQLYRAYGFSHTLLAVKAKFFCVYLCVCVLLDRKMRIKIEKKRS